MVVLFEKIAIFDRFGGDNLRIANYEYKSTPVQVQRPTRNLTPVPHLHKELEVVYVEQGSMIAFADENVCTVEAGNLYISFPNQIHYYQHGENCLFRVMIVTPDMFYGIKDQLCGNLPESNCVELDPDDPAKEYVMKISALSRDKDLTQYVGWFNLLFARILPKLKLSPVIMSDHSTLHSILTFCATHYAEGLSLDYVAGALHLSRCYVSHLFSQKLSLGFNDYINMLRTREACYLLQDTDKKIADISEEVGFGSIRSFNRAFIKNIGMTPADYRKTQMR